MSMAPLLKPVYFVLGVPRSGTTLLRVMLDGHPKVFSPPEMVIAPFETMAQRKAKLAERFWEKGGLRRALMELKKIDVDAAKKLEESLSSRLVPEVYAYLQEFLGDRILIDKCPHLCALPEAMERVNRWFPEARYLWITRHPGSVIRSAQNMAFAEVMLREYSGDVRDIWLMGNRNTQRFLDKIVGDRWCRIRYEDLVNDTRPTMEKVCRALDLPFDEAVLDPYQGDRMRDGPKGARAVGDPNLPSRGKIQPELATKWLDGFDPRSVSAETRSLARQLGYDLDTMPLPPLAKVSDALNGLWDAARALESQIDIPMDLDAVEGRRFLVRMLAQSIDTFVELQDAERTRFDHAEGPYRKMFGDCPDADYLRAPIKLGEDRAYRVWGRMPKGTTYVGVVLYGRGGRVGARMSDVQLLPDAEGRFDLRISTEKDSSHQGVWLQAEPDDNAVMVRQYFHDRERQAPIDLHIEKLGELDVPTALDAERFAKGIERAQRMVKAIFSRTAQAYRMASAAAMNRFVEIPADQLFPTPDNTYRCAWYRLAEGQVIVVRGRFPKARYASFTLYNAWMESLDYHRHQVSLNDKQVELEPDGSFEICVSPRDLGHKNWLDTAGHMAGYLLARGLLLKGDWGPLELEILYEKELAARKDDPG